MQHYICSEINMIVRQIKETNDKERKKILVMEDNESYQEFLTELLVYKGYLVEAVSDGQQGIYRYLEAKPDLIITDILMPNMDGFEVLARIKEINPMQPVIAISGYRKNNEVVFLDMIKALGAAESLTKPISVDRLIQTVEKLLKLSEK